MDFSFNNLIKFKNNKLIIYQIDKTLRSILTFQEIIEKAKFISKFLNKFNLSRHERISLKFSKSPEIIVLILSFLNDSYPFCPISTTINDAISLLDALKLIKSRYLFSETEIFELTGDFTLLDTIKLFSNNFYFYEITNQSSSAITIPNHCYSIKTSGSTGEPKVVHVPKECIWPNIISLSQIYSISKDDVIYIASPPTFDPFIVDVFLALHNGCSLFITSIKTELNKHLLCESLFENSVGSNVTIMCVTPSVFKLFGCDLIQNKILGNESTLRILAFGGEKFPTLKEIKLWLNRVTIPYKKRIFNIYGITEISCWAAIEEIKIFENIKSNEEILLGSTLDSDIILRVQCSEENNLKENGMGELLIGSSIRKCLINDENLEIFNDGNHLFRSTGDLVEIKENKIRYIGRKNSIIKRFGNRVSLTKIENNFKRNKHIEDAICTFENNKLILFLKTTSKSSFETCTNSLLNEEKPDKILVIKEFPLSSHGKISKRKLLEIDEKSNKSKSLKQIFRNHLETISGIKFIGAEQKKTEEKRTKSVWNSSFIELGGNSFQAINLLNELETFSNRSFPHIFEMLLNPELRIEEIYESVNNDLSYKVEKNLSHSSIENNNKLLEIKIAWKFNTKKCVDATPSILFQQNKIIISVGSHSHQLVNIDLKSGELLTSLELLDRIESKVEFDENGCGFVGCYDGAFYKFNPLSGNILWKFKSNGMIKCKALFSNESVIFGNYIDNKLFALNSQTGTVNWRAQTDASILSTPLLFDENTIIFCTLNGTVLSVDSKLGTILNTLKLVSPIFSNAVKLEANLFAVAEVSGLITFIDGKLNKVFTYHSEGNIFSSFALKRVNENVLNFVFGCYDHNVYNLMVNTSECYVNLKWKCKLQSQIYATPKIFEFYKEDLVIACTTLGWINILRLECSEILSSLQLGNEIFSSPECINNQIVVGCRDNYLYCFNIDKKV